MNREININLYYHTTAYLLLINALHLKYLIIVA